MAVSTSDRGARTITEGPLKVELSPELEICLVRASGELDCINAPVLDAQLHRLLTSTELRSVILDLSELEFIDSIGVECLLKATQWSREMAIVCGSSRSIRVSTALWRSPGRASCSPSSGPVRLPPRAPET